MQAVRSASAASLVLLALLWGGCQEVDVAAPPPPQIPVVQVVQRDQPITIELVGETRGSSDIPIRARVDGFLESMHFTEGRTVEKDQLLYTIDPQPFQAKVVEAKGYLAEARTMLTKAKADLDRVRPLAEINAVSQQDLDAAVAQHDAAIASVQAARAQVEQANIQLSYTKLHAPISGRIGISEAEIGEFVGKAPNPVVLNYVSKANPIRVRFSVDERSYLRMARQIREYERQEARGESREDNLELILADGSLHPFKGRVVASDASVDPTTGTFTLEADFENPDDLVLAGQFARIRGVIEQREGALLVPQRAISELQGNFRVFVITNDGKVEMRQVTPGPKIEQLQIVESGLNPGERVAVEGIQRLKPGMQVVPKPAKSNGPEPPTKAAATRGAS